MAYLNNNITYLNSRKEYKKDIPIIIKKCEFYTKKTNFIKFIIKLKQISIDLKKLKLL